MPLVLPKTTSKMPERLLEKTLREGWPCHHPPVHLGRHARGRRGARGSGPVAEVVLAVAAVQGLTLVHFSTRREQFLRVTLGVVSVHFYDEHGSG